MAETTVEKHYLMKPFKRVLKTLQKVSFFMFHVYFRQSDREASDHSFENYCCN